MAGMNGCMMGSLVCFFAFAILYLVSFGNPFWIVTNMGNWRHLGFKLERLGPGSSEPWMAVNFGLWLVCGQTRGCMYWTQMDDAITKSLRATQTMMCLGLLTLFGAIAAYVWWVLDQYRPAARRLAVVLTTITGLFGLISVCVFADFFKRNVTVMGWGFWNTVLCSIGLFLTGLLTAITLCFLPIGKKPPEDEFPMGTKKSKDPEKDPSPQSGSENPAYLATPGPAGLEPKEGFQEVDLNSSVAGSSIAGYGLSLPPLIPKVPVGAFSDSETETKAEVKSKPRQYYLTGGKAKDPFALEAERPPPTAPEAERPPPTAPEAKRPPPTAPKPMYLTKKDGDEKPSPFPSEQDTKPTYLTEQEQKPQYLTKGAQEKPTYLTQQVQKPHYLTQSAQEKAKEASDQEDSKPQFVYKPAYKLKQESQPSQAGPSTQPQYLYRTKQAEAEGQQPQYPYKSPDPHQDKPQYPYRSSHPQQDKPQYPYRYSDPQQDRPQYPYRASDPQQDKPQYPYRSSDPQQDKPQYPYRSPDPHQDKPQYPYRSSDPQQDKPQYPFRAPEPAKQTSEAKPQYLYRKPEGQSSAPQHPYRPSSGEGAQYLYSGPSQQGEYGFRPQAVSSRPTSDHTDTEV